MSPIESHFKPNSPIEEFRLSSFGLLSVETPEFVPQELDLTERDHSDCDSISSDDIFSSQGICHPWCMFSKSKDDDGIHRIFKCLKCDNSYVCEPCQLIGGHKGHGMYLEPVEND